MKKVIKSIIKRLVPKPIRNVRKKLSLADRLINRTKSIAPRSCPFCNYYGPFRDIGRPPRIDARCPSCGSLERHRLLCIALERQEIIFPKNLDEMSMLHFAPEKILRKYFEPKLAKYVTADLFRDYVDFNYDIEEINVEDNSFDIVLASHVLEHVDDKKAAREIYRILNRNGIFIAMVPIIEAWEKTYENSSVKTDEDRIKHFGQKDHLRFFGSDFAHRIEQSGLILDHECVAYGEDCVTYGLMRGEKVFVFKKPE